MQKLKSFLYSIVALVLLSLPGKSFAGPGDTLEVQVFTFGSAQDTAVMFPSDTMRFERIWLYYRLKCVPGNNPSCGEWDYLTYTNLYDSTGVLDSTLLTHPNFVIGNTTPNTYSYTNTPTYTWYQDWQYFTVIDNTTTENTYTLGAGATTINHPFASDQPDAKAQYLWTAAELSGAGLSAGDIQSIAFNLSSLGSSLQNLKIKLKHSSLTSFTDTNWETSGFTDVYELNTTFSTTGWNRINFLTPFNWDGTSNIVMEISFDNPTTGTASVVNGDVVGSNLGVYSAGMDEYLNFNGPDFVAIPSNPFNSVDSAITVSFWQYGDPAIQPQNNWTFEGVDANNNRVVNVHLPWGDGTVYWDAGNSGGGSYDRISKAANTADYEGQWNHWAFTKDLASGELNIYLNGVLWHTGTGLTRYMSQIERFRIGSTAFDQGNYDGYIDEFQVFNVALDAATISTWMTKDLTPAHPFYSNLLLYHDFNEGVGPVANDNSLSGNDGSLFGTPNREDVGGENVFRNFTAINERPQVEFIQGTYTTHLDSILVTDSLVNNIESVEYFSDSLNPTTSTDTVYVWPADVWTYTYDPNGIKVDSVWVSADTTINKVDWPYWSAPFEVIDRYEIHRFITPYGIGLDLGANGWLWKYDVTDYKTLLTGFKRLSAGNWQELLDMKFVFIEGTPARDPLKVENIWQGDFALSNFVNTVPAKTILFDAAASMFRMKTRATGHGFSNPSNCAEFCPKIHSVKVNGFQVRSWQILEECAENPLYPQGGTWIYDRSAWCPGKEGTTYDTEITDYVTPGDSETIDYDAVADPYGNYVFEGQVISYGPANFTLDAAIEDIVAPNNWEFHTRYNPICGQPIIKIRNNGTTVLTSMTISYGVVGGLMVTYNWTGSLDFLETETVTLPTFNWTAGNTFEASVSNPNGGSDEYSYNNTMQSKFATVPDYPGTFAVYFRTNGAGSETKWNILDAQGTIIYQNTIFLGPNLLFVDTINLPVGCYTMKLTDTGHDGLDFFANNDGTGYCKLRAIGGSYFKTFEPNFGKWEQQNFTVTNGVNIHLADVIENSIEVYPNPSKGEFTVEINGRLNEEVDLEVTDYTGKIIFSRHEKITANVITLPVSMLDKAQGIYFVRVSGESGVNVKKVSLVR